LYRAIEGVNTPTLGEWTWDDALTLQDTLSLHGPVYLPKYDPGTGTLLPAIVGAFINIKDDQSHSFVDTKDGQSVLYASGKHISRR
jgi:hypothetical protein